MRPRGQVLQKLQKRGIGPMNVLDHQHRWPGGGQRLQETSPGGERLLLRSPLAARFASDSDQRQQPRPEPGGVIIHRQHRFQLRSGHLHIIGVKYSRVALDDLSQRPERHPIAIGQAPPGPPRHQVGQPIDVGEQLGYQPGLAHPRRPGDRHQMHRAVADHAVQDPPQLQHLQIATHQRRVGGPDHISPQPGPRWAGPPQRHRVGLALHCHRLQRLIGKHPRRRHIRRLTHRHRTHRSH